MRDSLTDATRNAAVAKLGAIAADLDATTAQLAIAWCAKNPHVSTVITGASRIGQLQENMKALEVLPKLTPEVMAAIHSLTGGMAD